MLSPEDRATLLELLPSLAPGADAAPALRFFDEHRDACLAELGAVPGFDRVRAGLVRLLPAAVPDEAERAEALASAEQAIAAFDPDTLTEVGTLRRHPAWVGLCALELAGQRDDPDPAAATGRAVALAASGFARVSPGEARGRGEVLWALAEAASEVGWTDHVDPLLAQAALGPFADAENLGRVRLLQVLRLLADDTARAPAAVDALLETHPLDPQTRTHALWIGAHLDQQAGSLPRAIARLEEAVELVDPEEEPEVAGRIRSALAALGVGGDPAEA